METYIVYFDETGDDGITSDSSDHFILTSLYMAGSDWQTNYDAVRTLRKTLKDKFGFHIDEEMHTKSFLTDKNPYRNYHWSSDERKQILGAFIDTICADLQIKAINVLIDKTKIKSADYTILKNALTYNIQRIENDSNGKWKYIIITDQGRIAPMRSTAREIRSFNPVPSKYSWDKQNKPISNLIEDILEKNSKESYFIQITDFISYFTHLFYRVEYQKNGLPNRVSNLIDEDYVRETLRRFKKAKVLNLKANEEDPYGLVIYPK